MKITLHWLKDHLESTATLSEIRDRLVSLGLEVESVHNPATLYNGFIIAKVIERAKHPNADRLSVCKVDVGTGSLLQVVCGAPNVRAGMNVIFAPIGTKIPVNDMVLKPSKIRDVESQGMLCSARELLFGEDQDGIMDLQVGIDIETDTLPGTSLIEAFGLDDPVIDVSVTPNRGDCFGIRGIARDLAASGLGSLKPLAYPSWEGTFSSPLSVHLEENSGCFEFHGCFIRNVQNGPSPKWVQRRLTAVGMRCISALVDMTNYLTLDLGRPLHVFDADKICSEGISHTLTVRQARSGESLDALNDKTYDLDAPMTVIAHHDHVLALGGIMGGLSSGCTEETKNVFIEGALFDPIRIAETGRRLNLLSDARTRFERGVDPQSLSFGMDAAVHLIQQWCGGVPSHRVKSNMTTAPAAFSERHITLTHQKLTGLTGMNIGLDQAAILLEKLAFVLIEQTPDSITVSVPSHRLLDIDGPADLVEEVLRLIGYDHLPAIGLPLSSHSFQQTPPSMTRMARSTLSSRGFHELVTWSFMDEDMAVLFDNNAQQTKKGLGDGMYLDNPMTIHMAVLRPSILPNLLKAAAGNEARGSTDIALFEIGPQFQDQAGKTTQTLVASGLLTGKTGRHWSEKNRNVDVYDIKAHVLAVLSAAGIAESGVQIDAEAPTHYHPGRCGRYRQGNRVLAYFGDIHPSLIQKAGLEQTAVGFEIFLDQFPPFKIKKTASDLSPYQAVFRDFAFVLPQHVSADTLIRAVTKVDRQLIHSVHVFDVYTGDKLPADMKSLAIQVRLEPKTATLTDDEITAISQKIIQSVAQTTGGGLRQS